jgi:hypothetical protein
MQEAILKRQRVCDAGSNLKKSVWKSINNEKNITHLQHRNQSQYISIKY